MLSFGVFICEMSMMLGPLIDCMVGGVMGGMIGYVVG